jgi:hypothetical protein
MASVLEGFLVRLGFQVDKDGELKFGQSVANARERLMSIGKAAVATGAAVTAAFAKTTQEVNDNFNFSRSVGTSIRGLSSLEGAVERVGGSAESVRASFQQLAENLKMPNAPQWAQQFGIDVIDEATGKYRDTSEIFLDMAKRIRETAETQGVAVAKAQAEAMGLGASFDAIMKKEFPEELERAAQMAGVFSDSIQEGSGASHRFANEAQTSFSLVGGAIQSLTAQVTDYLGLDKKLASFNDSLADGLSDWVNAEMAILKDSDGVFDYLGKFFFSADEYQEKVERERLEKEAKTRKLSEDDAARLKELQAKAKDREAKKGKAKIRDEAAAEIAAGYSAVAGDEKAAARVEGVRIKVKPPEKTEADYQAALKEAIESGDLKAVEKARIDLKNFRTVKETKPEEGPQPTEVKTVYAEGVKTPEAKPEAVQPEAQRQTPQPDPATVHETAPQVAEAPKPERKADDKGEAKPVVVDTEKPVVIEKDAPAKAQDPQPVKVDLSESRVREPQQAASVVPERPSRDEPEVKTVYVDTEKPVVIEKDAPRPRPEAQDKPQVNAVEVRVDAPPVKSEAPRREDAAPMAPQPESVPKANPYEVEKPDQVLRIEEKPRSIHESEFANVRGIRNNNPGNLVSSRLASGKEAGGRGRFATFDSPEKGYQAMAEQLKAYQNAGLENVASIVRKWAPPNENNTGSYINSVVQQMKDALGVEMNAFSRVNLSDPKVLKALSDAIINHENGHGAADYFQGSAFTAAAESAAASQWKSKAVTERDKIPSSKGPTIQVTQNIRIDGAQNPTLVGEKVAGAVSNLATSRNFGSNLT